MCNDPTPRNIFVKKLIFFCALFSAGTMKKQVKDNKDFETCHKWHLMGSFLS
jgi:CRISPR/Cas system CMR-associated protein Cmr3 (group 5 of RAMP superfamily)